MYFQAIVNSFSGLGPFCFHFNKDEQHTVLNLKQKLEQATAISVHQQRIRSIAGRLLTDNDLLFDDALIAEPLILNMTVRLIGGRNNEENHYNRITGNNKSCLPSTILLDQQPLKRSKINDNEQLFTQRKRIEEIKDEPRQKEEELMWKKGKEKETRKRKNFA